MSENLANLKSEPVSRQKIRSFAEEIRNKFNFNDNASIPILNLVENILPNVDENFNYEVISVNEFVADNILSTTEIYPDDEVIIKIREDVYGKAYSGDGRSRFTIAHEVGHYFFVKVFKMDFTKLDIEISELPAYLNPEWQAETFASEFLIPQARIGHLSAQEIVSRYLVSNEAAIIAKHINTLIT